MEELRSPFTLTPNEPPDFFTRFRYPILGVLILGLATGTYLTLTPPQDSLAGNDVWLTDEATKDASSADEVVIPANELVVDISGGVKNPGVYYLAGGSIVETAIEASGGFSTQADLGEVARSINRAQLIDNHSKIYIPQRGDTRIVYTTPASSSASNNRININTASASELEALTGIGEILAQRIVDYRLEHGNFTAVGDIKKVAGISENKFLQLMDEITV